MASLVPEDEATTHRTEHAAKEDDSQPLKSSTTCSARFQACLKYMNPLFLPLPLPLPVLEWEYISHACPPMGFWKHDDLSQFTD